MPNFFRKKLNITFSVTGIVALILAIITGILLFRRGINVTNTALQWLFGLSIGIIVLAFFGWIFWITIGRKLKFVKKK